MRGIKRSGEPGERPLRLVADAPATRIQQQPLGLGFRGVAGNWDGDSNDQRRDSSAVSEQAAHSVYLDSVHAIDRGAEDHDRGGRSISGESVGGESIGDVRDDLAQGAAAGVAGLAFSGVRPAMAAGAPQATGFSLRSWLGTDLPAQSATASNSARDLPDATPGSREMSRPGGAPVPRYSELRMLGQLFAGYIVLEDDDGLILVDQHAAHERVTYERLSTQLRAGGVRSQALLTPAPLELGVVRAAQVRAGLAELRAIGFDLEPFGPSTLLLKGVPAVFGPEGGMGLLTDLLDGIGDHGLRARGEGAFEDLLKRLACHGSVRVGRVLAPGEITALLAELDATAFKSNCPHGRPVHIRFARGQIERLFRR